VDGKDEGTGAPMSCAIIYWGCDFQCFFEVFIKFGAVINIENLRGVQMGFVNGNGKGRK
jgi:hypothetical protein